jgi:vancomycin resistance protein YoaR
MTLLPNRPNARKIAMLWSVPVLFAAAGLLCDPFAREVDVRKVSIDLLTPSQRSNITTASRALNGYVVRPHETFSFNKVVGPRTFRRGYSASPSYLEADTANTFGGGICALSSLLYQVALKGGLVVTERHGHTRPIKTVPPGLDATVWYGGPDLKFTNPYPFPIQLRAASDGGELRLCFAIGRFAAILPEPEVKTITVRVPNADSCIDVIVARGENSQLVSHDVVHTPRSAQ